MRTPSQIIREALHLIKEDMPITSREDAIEQAKALSRQQGGRTVTVWKDKDIFYLRFTAAVPADVNWGKIGSYNAWGEVSPHDPTIRSGPAPLTAEQRQSIQESKLHQYKVGGWPVLLHPECVDGFKEDRSSGLIYGPYKKPTGGFYMNAEEWSTAEHVCPYCGRGDYGDLSEAFTRQHYVRIAQALRQAQESVAEAGLPVIKNLADELANMFTEDNPRFDRSRFMAACGF
jgi:hypothetical protein